MTTEYLWTAYACSRRVDAPASVSPCSLQVVYLNTPGHSKRCGLGSQDDLGPVRMLRWVSDTVDSIRGQVDVLFAR